MNHSFLIKISLLFAAFLAALFYFPPSASAHLVTTGMGPVYDGIGHLLLTPEDLVPALAVALYAGLRGPTAGRFAIFLFPAAWLLGGILGLQTNVLPAFPMASLSFLVLGLLIAADLNLPTRAFTFVAVVIGLIHGFCNGIALQQGPAGQGLLGIMAALFVLVTLVSTFVVSLKPPWARIVVRVLGSWVAAIGILMIGWYMRSGMV